MPSNQDGQKKTRVSVTITRTLLSGVRMAEPTTKNHATMWYLTERPELESYTRGYCSMIQRLVVVP